MGNEILKNYMMSFSIETLRRFLGEDLVESLLEWHTGTDAFLTKSRLSDMILCIHGINILKNSDFREQLVRTMAENEILTLAEAVDYKLDKNEEKATTIAKVARMVARVGWNKNRTSDALLQILSYDPLEVFERAEEDIVSSETISSYDKFYELLDYQYVIRQRALNILTSSYSLQRFLIHMPTGTGKTKTAVHIICHHYNYNLKRKGLVIWVAHTIELLQQAYETFVSVWKNIGNGEIQTYKLWGNNSYDFISEEISGFMVCGIQKLQSIMKTQKDIFDYLVDNTSLIVYDEAHKAAAKGTKAVIDAFMIRKEGMCNRALMGLSATPGRSTAASFDNDILVSMFENKIIEINTEVMNAVNMSLQEAINTKVETDIIRYFQNRGVLAKIKKEELEYPESLSEQELQEIKVIATSNGYEDFSPNALKIIGRNKSRNLAILQKLRELHSEGKATIVFACSVQQGQLLASMLTLDDIPNALVIGDMSPKERREAISSFKNPDSKVKIIINYEVLTTGFDATNIECVFIARPTQSVVLYSQMIGRGLRGPQMGGNEECLLIDVKDNLLKYNENLAFSHFDNYWNI